jgi:hypothetical protein
MDSPRGWVISQNPVVEPVVPVQLIAGDHGGGWPGFPGTVTVTVLVLVLTVAVVVVLVVVLVLGDVVVEPVVVVELVVEPVVVADVVEVVEIVVVSVVVEDGTGVVVLVVAPVREVVVSGVNGLGPVLEPPKMKKTISDSRNAPSAPKLTSAHGLRYHGSPDGGCWP